MPIENPIISTIGGPAGQAEPLRIDTQAMDSAFTSLGEVVRDVKVEKTTAQFKADLDKEESAYIDELYGLIQERDTQEVLEEENQADGFVSPNPEVRKMMLALREEDAAASQGVIDSNRLGVRKEMIFREYAAKYPRLIPEFLKTASSSGLGGTSSLQTQEMVDYLNDGARQRKAAIKASGAKQAEYRKAIEKNSRILGVEPPPPNSSPEVEAQWLEKYIAAATQNELYMADKKGHALWKNSNTRTETEVKQAFNNLATRNSSAIVGQVYGSLNDYAANVFGVSDVSQLTEAVFSGDLDKQKLDMQAHYDAWKQNEMRQITGAGGGEHITPAMWKDYFGPADAFVAQVLNLVGTKEIAEKIKGLQSVQKAQYDARLPRNLAYAAELSATLAQTGNQVAKDVSIQTASALATAIKANLDAEVAGAQVGEETEGRPGLVNQVGQATPFGGWNAIRAADAVTGIPQIEKDKLAAEHLANTDAAIRAGDKAPTTGDTAKDARVRTGRMAQVVSSFDTVAEKAALANKRGKAYLPEDSLIENLVKSASSEEFGELFAQLTPRDQAIARDTMKTVLDYETAYIAQLLNKRLENFSEHRRGQNRLSMAVFAGMAGAPGAELRDEGNDLGRARAGGELFVMNIDSDTGDISFSINNAAKAELSPAQLAEAEREVRNLTGDKAYRIANALRAQVRVGNYASYEEALLAASEVEGWPKQLGLAATGPAPAKKRSKAEQDAALESAQKGARGE